MERSNEELLCDAAKSGDSAILQELLMAGADPSFFDSNGISPLMHAASLGHADAIRLLLDAGSPWNALSPLNLSAGDLAMENSHHESFEILLNFAIRAELVLGKAADGSSSQNEYLAERVWFGEDSIMDEDNKSVMMAWEKPLMEAHARAICSSGDNGGRILNVGFGMGLVDEAIQRYMPVEHVIVEAHPEIYDRMLKNGWGKKENVSIVFGKWQDVISQLGSFDGIFFDTYGEYYEDMREFHKHLPTLLKPDGIYSYFNGLCGTNAFFHVVYCNLVSLELENLGLRTQFISLPVKESLPEGIWETLRHKYWQLEAYNLPVCQALLHDSE